MTFNKSAFPAFDRAVSLIAFFMLSGAVAGTANAAATVSDDPCLPSAMPSTAEIFGSSKKVFAHYFYPFPISIDNAPPASDYYNGQYLNAHGESNKWLSHGGYLRQRPLGKTPSPGTENWRFLNMEAEVRSAIARGISGFTFDAMSVEAPGDTEGPLHLLLAAAADVDSRFKIIVMPDLTALKTDAAGVEQIIALAAGSPAAYRLSDGRLVVSAFDASLNSAGWWESVLTKLSDEGIKVAFVPTFVGWSNEADAFAPISYGIGAWGTATVPSALYMQEDPGIVHSVYHRIFMMPVDPQQFRPKDFEFWEAGNSAAFRHAWMSAIAGDADWIQLVTWNDFSESGEVEPFTDASLSGSIGTGYYDLTGYYAAWFASGQEPRITHDVLYYFYRREPTSSAGHAQGEKDQSATGASENDIELLAFLTSPGVLKITIGGKTYAQNATAGITSFKIPTQPGVPVFSLTRNGSQVFSLQGGVQIYGAGGLPSGTIDLTYWTGSASKSGVCSL
jgi:hypothetical protein